MPTQAVSLQLSPPQAAVGPGQPASYVLTVTNVGDVTDTYNLVLNGVFPANTSSSFTSTAAGFTPASGNASATLTVPPGLSNARQVTLTITTPQTASAGNLPFAVLATSTTAPSVTSSAPGSVNVLATGVGVTLSPQTASPGSQFMATVTNTGKVTGTYDLTLAGPARLVSKLGMTQVTLAPGASQVVPISTGAINFAVQGRCNWSRRPPRTAIPR